MYVHELSRWNLRHAAAMLVPACLLLALTTSLEAASGDTWQLEISEKENQLAYPNDPMWMKVNMWDNSYQRMMARNMPTLELTNLQPAGGPDLTQLQLTIGDTRFHFTDAFLGSLALLGNTTPGFTLTPTLADGGDRLIIDIAKNGGGGIDPNGDLVRFRIQLAVDNDPSFTDPPFFAHPDYRTVLFDINAGGGPNVVEVYGPSPNAPNDNAQASVKFSDNTTKGPVAFEDQILPADEATYYNNIYRAYGLGEPVGVFLVGGGEVPEPGGAALVAIGSIGFLLRRRARCAALAG